VRFKEAWPCPPRSPFPTIGDRENQKIEIFIRGLARLWHTKKHQHHVDADGSDVPVILKFNR
jgi:hypothetical protein